MSNFGQEKQVQASYFGLEVDGINLGFFTACSGLSSELEVATQKGVTPKGASIEVKQPGRQSFSEVTLKRGVTADLELNKWFDETVDAAQEITYKSASIVCMSRDMSTEIARFNLEDAFPSKLSMSDLDTGSSEAMVEDMTIRHHNLIWA
ncbi:MAG: phage tail-like protein [Candidatus Aldehydirespiratoraceae bacterium]|jgi:phage tail-like protein